MVDTPDVVSNRPLPNEIRICEEASTEHFTDPAVLDDYQQDLGGFWELGPCE
jgi:hypothetical protein